MSAELSPASVDISERPGRTCPLAYRYSPHVFRREPEIRTDVLYVVGGLYGNGWALDALLAMAREEASTPVIVFNGDFNWFNRDASRFFDLNSRVLQHVALRGNVETELAGEDYGAGCGCGYPDGVSDAEVERSNIILSELRAAAMPMSELRATLGALPMHATAEVGGAKIGIVHGDAESLAGWGFAHDQMDDPSRRGWINDVFKAAGVDLFASSHTCLPALRTFQIDGKPRIVVNNGAAGMPNFAGIRSGLITRVALTPTQKSDLTLNSARIGEAHIETLRLDYDFAGWEREFLSHWPPGSPAHESYFQRIQQGPRFTPAQAFARP